MVKVAQARRVGATKKIYEVPRKKWGESNETLSGDMIQRPRETWEEVSRAAIPSTP